MTHITTWEEDYKGNNTSPSLQSSLANSSSPSCKYLFFFCFSDLYFLLLTPNSLFLHSRPAEGLIDNRIFHEFRLKPKIDSLSFCV
jgi:hypothetical protein